MNIEKVDESYFKFEYGYFLFQKEEDKWVFVPFEKFFDEEMLKLSLENLNSLNSKRKTSVLS
jgi:hypothetical protein